MFQAHWRLVALIALSMVCASGVSAAEPAPKRDEPKANQQKPTKPKPLITVLKETTFVTEPVDEAGYVDILAALNARLSQGVTKENNAAIPLLQIVGPEMIPEKHREQTFRLLGMEPLPVEGDYFVHYDDYVRRVNELTEPGRHEGPYKDLDENAFNEAVYSQFGESSLWKAEDHPVLAGWVKKNDKALDRVAAATERSRYYLPLVTDDLLVGVLLQDLQMIRELTRALVARATLRAQEGKLDLALADLLACHRLARLMGNSPFLIGALVSIALDSMAHQAETALVQQGKLTAKQALDYAAALRALPPRPTFADAFDVGERLFFIDLVISIARKGPKILQTISEFSGEQELTTSPLLLKAIQTGVDWDQVLRNGNGWIDRLADAARQPNYAEQQAAVAAIERDIKQLVAGLNDWKAVALMTFNQGVRATATHRISGTLIGLLLPATGAALNAENRARATADQAQIVLAIAAYRADEGRDPETLESLLRKYLEKLPHDPFTGKPFRYEAKPDGFLLYSLGPNTQDDGGRHLTDEPSGDDVRVRVERK